MEGEGQVAGIVGLKIIGKSLIPELVDVTLTSSGS